MANTMTIQNVQDLLDPNMEQIFYNYMAVNEPFWSRIAKRTTTSKYNSEISMISGLPVASETQLYQKPGVLAPTQGYSQSQTQKKVSFEVIVYEEMWRFVNEPGDLLAMFGDNRTTSAMFRPIDSYIDNAVAKMFTHGESLTGPDAVYYASASHPLPDSSNEWSNYLASGSARPLQESYVKDMLTLINQCPDLNGEPAELLDRFPAQMLVSPANQQLAMRICQSVGMPGTANNDINALPEMGLSRTPLVWSRLDSAFKGSNNVDWWIFFPQVSIYVVFGVDPFNKSWVDNDDNYHFVGKCFVDVIFVEPRGYWFADGA